MLAIIRAEGSTLAGGDNPGKVNVKMKEGSVKIFHKNKQKKSLIEDTAP